jgi:hypothetical protein
MGAALACFQAGVSRHLPGHTEKRHLNLVSEPFSGPNTTEGRWPWRAVCFFVWFCFNFPPFCTWVAKAGCL